MQNTWWEAFINNTLHPCSFIPQSGCAEVAPVQRGAFFFSPAVGVKRQASTLTPTHDTLQVINFLINAAALRNQRAD